MDNKTMLLVLMVVLIAFIVLLAVLGIVFIIALRKRAPVVKVLMAPIAAAAQNDDDEEEEEEPVQEQAEEPAEQLVMAEVANEEPAPAPKPAPKPVEEEEEEDDDDNDETTFVMEGQERVRYDRSFEAKICQLKNESKEWYSQLKNELLSYDRVKTRMSWRRETFRVGRMPFARFVVRGKTLCLLVAVEPSGYTGTKFNVEDVSNIAATADTPTLYRIKSVRRLKYAKEMIAGIMKELKLYKNTKYEPQDFFVPYEGDMALMSRGMIKRVVTTHTRTFKVEDGGKTISEVAASEAEAQQSESAESGSADNA